MQLADIVARNRDRFSPMFEPALTAQNTMYMELSNPGDALAKLDEAALDAEIFERIESAGAIAGVGGYLENRSVYKDTELFQGDAERCIHIGVDVFLPSGCAVHAPLDASVHSFADRQVYGDYGPVIILRHQLDGFEFFSLYGHLSQASLNGLSQGRAISQGENFAEIGARPINGNWTPHLHFQLIRDMQGMRGDYPGVVRAEELDFYRVNCPDPSALLLS